jgi:hypothetical protein
VFPKAVNSNTEEENPDDLKTILIEVENSKAIITGDYSSLMKASYTDLPKDSYISIIYLGRIPTNATDLDYGEIEDTDTNKPQAFCLFPKTLELPKYAIEVGSNFKVTATGGLYAEEGTFNGSLIASSGGQLANFNFKDSNLDCPSLTITDDSL